TDCRTSLDRASSEFLEQSRCQLGRCIQPLKVFFKQIFNMVTLVLLMALATSFSNHAWIEGGHSRRHHHLSRLFGLKESPTHSTTWGRQHTACFGTTLNVIPGDIVDLTTGDSVPTDIRLIHAVNLEANEAFLMGSRFQFLRTQKPHLTMTPAQAMSQGGLYLYNNHQRLWLWRCLCNWHVHRNRTHYQCVKGADLMGKGIEWGPQTAQPECTAKMWPNAMMGRLGRFLNLTVDTPLQKEPVCHFIYYHNGCGHIPVSLILVLTVTIAAGTMKKLERHVIVRNLSSLEALGGVTSKCPAFTLNSLPPNDCRQSIASGAWYLFCRNDQRVTNRTVSQVSFSPIQPRDVKEIEKQPSETQVNPLEEVDKKPFLQNYTI
ncbi:hypothetical protein CFAM422_009353, partial [Trichoderma lentiforme]